MRAPIPTRSPQFRVTVKPAGGLQIDHLGWIASAVSWEGIAHGVTMFDDTSLEYCLNIWQVKCRPSNFSGSRLYCLYNQALSRSLNLNLKLEVLSLSMLARRVIDLVITQPATTLRRDSQLQKWFIHPSRSQLQALPRPNTLAWLAKIRFRADGKPRSKLIASGFG